MWIYRVYKLVHSTARNYKHTMTRLVLVREVVANNSSLAVDQVRSCKSFEEDQLFAHQHRKFNGYV